MMSGDKIKLYTKHAISATWHLSAAQAGAFFMLLMWWSRHGKLPETEELIANVTRMGVAAWREQGPAVLELFQSDRWGEIPAVTCLDGDGPESRPPIPADLRKAVYAKYDKRVYCGASEGPFEIDHVHPWSRGGRHEAGNLVLACMPCNRSKGAQIGGSWQQ